MFLTDYRGPSNGFAALIPWKERSDLYQIVTSDRKVPSGGIMERVLEVASERAISLITPLSSPWSLRHFKQWGFSPIQTVHSYLKSDNILPPPIVWVQVEPLADCATQAELRELDHSCFPLFWQLCPAEQRRTLKTELSLGARANGRLLGYASAVTYGSHASIGRLAVRTDSRRQGVGSALLRAMVQSLHKQGVIDIGVTTQSENLPAQALYQSYGFFAQGQLDIMGLPAYGDDSKVDWGL